MAHIRDRYLAENVKKQLRFMPCVSVTGMRQTGKTTLCKSLAASYLTLDDDSLRLNFEQSNWSAIENLAEPACIDEIQKVPAIFDRLKLMIDQRKRPGRFLITGSIRFASKKDIKESLTGRTSTLEIFPLTVAESHQLPSLPFYGEVKRYSEESLIEFLEDREWLTEAKYENYLRSGGLPGICFARDQAIRSALWQAHIETLLSRDLDFIYPNKLPFARRLLALKLVLQNRGFGFSAAEVARRVGCSQPTLAKLLLAFEGLFLIRRHGTLKPVFYGEDLGLTNYLAPLSDGEERAKLLQFIFRELKSQLSYFHPEVSAFDLVQSRGGIDIPFVIFESNKPTTLISVSESDGASDKSLKSLTWFEKGMGKGKLKKIVIHGGNKGYVSSSGVPCVPARWIV